MSIALWSDHVVAVSLQLLLLGCVALLLDFSCLRRASRIRELLWSLVLLRALLPVQWFEAEAGSPLALASVIATKVAPSDAAFFVVQVCLATACILLGWTLHRRRVARLRNGSRPLDEASCWFAAWTAALQRCGQVRVPSVRLVAAPITPCVVGIWRPTLFLPLDGFVPGEASGGAADRDLEHVLLHELAHLRRRDPLRATASLVVQGLYCFHPVVWVAASRLALAREVSADRLAAAWSRHDAVDYGRTLLRFAAMRQAPGLAFGRASTIARRVQALVDGPQRSARSAAVVVAFLMSMAAGAIGERAGAVDAQRDSLGDFRLEHARGCLQKRYLVFQAMASHFDSPQEHR